MYVVCCRRIASRSGSRDVNEISCVLERCGRGSFRIIESEAHSVPGGLDNDNGGRGGVNNALIRRLEASRAISLSQRAPCDHGQEGVLASRLTTKPRSLIPCFCFTTHDTAASSDKYKHTKSSNILDTSDPSLHPFVTEYSTCPPSISLLLSLLLIPRCPLLMPLLLLGMTGQAMSSSIQLVMSCADFPWQRRVRRCCFDQNRFGK